MNKNNSSLFINKLIDATSFNTQFKKTFKVLHDYYEKNGEISSIKINDTYSYNGDTVYIGLMIKKLRRQYKLAKNKDNSKIAESKLTPLTSEQISLLEDLGMIWDFNDVLQRVAPFIDYCNKTKKSINDIKEEDLYNYNGKDIHIGWMLNTFRVKYAVREKDKKSITRQKIVKPITDAEVKALEDLGIIWQKRHSFQDRVAPIIDYYKKHGSIAKITYYEIYQYNGKEFPIGKRLSNFREEYKLRSLSPEEQVARKKKYGTCSPLTDEEVLLLESMGMVWDKRKNKNINL